MSELLLLYDKLVSKYNKKVMMLDIYLTPKFLKTCRQRIILGNLKYGDDWKRKDNLKELEFEKYDIFNYFILHHCQKKYLKNKRKKRI